MSSQIYNSHKYSLSKTSLNGGRIPYCTNLSEIKTDFSFTSLCTSSHIWVENLLHTLFVFNFLFYLWKAFVGWCVHKEPKAPRWCLKVGICHRAGLPIILTSSSHIPHKLIVTRSKRGWVCFILFYLEAALPVLECSKVFCHMSSPSFSMYGIYNGKTFLFLHICIAASDPFVNRSDNSELLEFLATKIATQG